MYACIHVCVHECTGIYACMYILCMHVSHNVHVSVMHNACVHILYAYKIKFKIQFFYYDKCSVLFDLQMKKTIYN